MKSSKRNGRVRKHVPPKLLVELAQRGHSTRAIAQQLAARGFNISRSTVRRRLEEQGLLKASTSKSDSSKQLGHTKRFSRCLVRLVRRSGFSSTAEICRQLNRDGYDVSRRTVVRRLSSIDGLRSAYPGQQQYLTAAQRAERLSWARSALAQHIDWTKVYFADEKTWTCDGPVRRCKMWYDTRDPPPALFRRGACCKGVAVWGAFSDGRAADLESVSTHINSEEYCHVLEASLLSQRPTRSHVLYHDQHTAHRSARTRGWMQQHGIEARLFPPKAADLNPIENVWAILMRRVYADSKTYDSAALLLAAVEDAWASFRADRGLRDRLARSMPRRLEQVIERKGKPADF